MSGDLLDVIMGGQYCEQHGVRDVVKAREDLPLLVEVLGEGPLAELELLREVGQCSGLGRLSAVTTLKQFIVSVVEAPFFASKVYLRNCIVRVVLLINLYLDNVLDFVTLFHELSPCSVDRSESLGFLRQILLRCWK